MIRTLNEATAVLSQVDERPHVLLVVDQLPQFLGGGERIVLRLAELLPQYGYRASILTFASHPRTTAIKSAACPVYLLPLTRTYDLQAMRAAVELRRFIKQQQVQIVQTFFESSDIWAGTVTKLLSSAKLIWSRRDMGILRGRKHQVSYQLLKKMPDAVFAVSDQVRAHCIQTDGVPSSRVHTIYNGLNLANLAGLQQTSHANRERVIATVGNIRKVKGHDVLIRAAASIVERFPMARFSIAGEVLEPEYFKELQDLVRQLELTEHVRFVGGVTDLRQFFSDVDIFVLPSRSEGFSNAIIEAMAASLPVVATDVGGNAEAIENGKTGLIITSEDATALSSALSRLLEDDSLVEKMGAAGRSRAVQNFSVETMMERITRTYKDLLSKNIA